MARKRQIDPDIWTSVQFTNLKDLGARVLFIAMFSNADDEGRLRAHPAYLKMVAFPRDSYTEQDILDWRNQIETQGLIKVYSNGSNPDEYLYLPTFPKHQAINKRYPSKLPPPPTVPLPHTDGSVTTPLPHSDGISTVHLLGKSGVGSVSNSDLKSKSDMDSVSESGIEKAQSYPQTTNKTRSYPQVVERFVDNSPRPTDPTESEATLDEEKGKEDIEPIEDYIKRLHKEFFGELIPTPKTIPKIDAAITGISQFSDDDIWLAFEKASKRKPPPTYPLGYVARILKENKRSK